MCGAKVVDLLEGNRLPHTTLHQNRQVSDLEEEASRMADSVEVGAAAGVRADTARAMGILRFGSSLRFIRAKAVAGEDLAERYL